MILMWSSSGNMPKYYPCLGNILAYYLDKTTLLYKYINDILLNPTSAMELILLVSHFNETNEPSQESKKSCICVLR